MLLKKAASYKGELFWRIWFTPDNFYICNQVNCKYSTTLITGEKIGSFGNNSMCEVCSKVRRKCLRRTESHLIAQYSYAPKETNKIL